jgi:acyl-homoserine-lactone acylase
MRYGMIYAQAEDDFPGSNAITWSIWAACPKRKGSAIWQDLRQRLFIDPDRLKADYAQSPPGCAS